MASRRPGRRNNRRKSKKEAQVSAREQINKNDNKMAMQILGGCIIGFLVIFGLFSLSDKEPVKKKERTVSGPIEVVGGDNRPTPKKKSLVPIQLAEKFLLALANEDETAINDLMAWDVLFAKVDDLNNRQVGERYKDLDDAAKKKLRNKYIDKVMDEDLASLVREFAQEDLLDGKFIPENINIGIDYGNVDMLIEDAKGRPKLMIRVKSSLLPGYHTVRDVANLEAWGIVTIQHQLQGKVTATGVKMRMRNKNPIDDIYKKPKKKRVRRPAGPPEEKPSLVDWPKGMSDATKSKMESQVATLTQTDNFRSANDAKFAMIDRGKAAIPALLRSLSQLDFEEDNAEIAKAFQIIQTLREITGLNFNFQPAQTRQGFGAGGMTRSTPEERLKAVRRWFGWWKVNKSSWTKKIEAKDPESWDELIGETDKDKKKKKK